MKWLTHFYLCLLAATLLVSVAEGAGSLTVTVTGKDASGAIVPLTYAYVYLRSTANDPPMERYYSPADLIGGPSSVNGMINVTNIPEGDYYVRITRRNPLGGQLRPLGPPEPGDYTWNQARPITISSNTTTNLGTKVTWAYGSAQTSISGTVTSYAGVPLSGRYVKATVVPCIEADGYSGTPSNQCGPEKHLALERTDADGKYTLFLRAPGTFYIYESTCLGDHHQEYTGNPCIGYGTGPITVNSGEQKIVNITGN